MCGRYALTASAEELAEAFGLAHCPALAPRWNVAPGQTVPVVCLGAEGERELVRLRWGLVPGWARDPAIGHRLINARAETLAVKPAFRAAFRHRRCLVPVSGFYEWRGPEGHKQPCYVRRADGRPFALAGLWEHWAAEGQPPLGSFTVVTTEASEQLRELHDRMPVIVAPADHGRWLGADPREAQALLRPWPEALLWYPVRPRVNNPQNDGPDCVEPAA